MSIKSRRPSIWVLALCALMWLNSGCLRQLMAKPVNIPIDATSLPVYRIAKRVLQEEGYTIRLDMLGNHLTVSETADSPYSYALNFSDREGKTQLRVTHWSSAPSFLSPSTMLPLPQRFRPTLERIKREVEAETHTAASGAR